MGRMKEFCIDIINANGGIPEGITIADVVRMKELDMYNWEEYERDQEKRRLQFIKSENSGETAKMEQTSKIFRDFYNQTREEKERSEQ
jgi:hypothetical protein